MASLLQTNLSRIRTMRGLARIPADVISEATRARLPELAAQFQRREPFRHVVIDDFLDRARPTVCSPSFRSSMRSSR
jgi:hypothetical protein